MHLSIRGFCSYENGNAVLITQALVQQEKDLTQQIKSLETQIQQTVPDKNHLKQLEQKVKELEKGLHDYICSSFYFLRNVAHFVEFIHYKATIYTTVGTIIRQGIYDMRELSR